MKLEGNHLRHWQKMVQNEGQMCGVVVVCIHFLQHGHNSQQSLINCVEISANYFLGNIFSVQLRWNRKKHLYLKCTHQSVSVGRSLYNSKPLIKVQLAVQLNFQIYFAIYLTTNEKLNVVRSGFKSIFFQFNLFPGV